MRARVGFEPMIARAVVVALMGATLCLNAGAQSAQLSGKSQITNAKVEAREVKAGFECGLSLKNYNDINEGDQLEAYEVLEVARTL